jgi:hypothetical protein
MEQRQIGSGGSTGQGVIRRMNSARARAQGTEAGQRPDTHKRIAQSIAYVCARAGIGSDLVYRNLCVQHVFNGASLTQP